MKETILALAMVLAAFAFGAVLAFALTLAVYKVSRERERNERAKDGLHAYEKTLDTINNFSHPAQSCEL